MKTVFALILSLYATFCLGSINTENQLPGDRNYFWTGTISDNLVGFSDPYSVNLGQTISFKINATSNNWTIDIYRIGYYGGAGGRRITTLSESSPSVQPAYTVDAATGMVDASNWAVTAAYTTGSAPSGVYVASLKDIAGNQFVIPFVVRDDNTYHDILYQTSDTTWAAYTGWGGYNFYGPSSGWPAGPGAQGQAYKVSYNRPFSTAYGWGNATGPQDSFFNSEVGAVHWLEKNGYDVKYQGGVDTDAIGVHNTRIFISCGHDEYWSNQQRSNVYAARDSGINLCFWSGNTCYWRCRWEADFKGESHRVLVCYKDTWANQAVDPVEPTLQFRDTRFGNTDYPENNLLGQMTACDGTYTPNTDIQVPDASNPIWAGTTLPGTIHGLLGYESDTVNLGNGYSPPGLILLSSTSFTNSQLLPIIVDDAHPWPSTLPGGDSIHNITIYTAPSGALVFDAGTVFWSWGLDGDHDFSAGSTTGQPDPNVQKAMSNLFSEMGVTPKP